VSLLLLCVCFAISPAKYFEVKRQWDWDREREIWDRDRQGDWEDKQVMERVTQR